MQGASAAEIHAEASLPGGMTDLEQRALDALRDGRCRVNEVLPILAP